MIQVKLSAGWVQLAFSSHDRPRPIICFASKNSRNNRGILRTFNQPSSSDSESSLDNSSFIPMGRLSPVDSRLFKALGAGVYFYKQKKKKSGEVGLCQVRMMVCHLSSSYNSETKNCFPFLFFMIRDLPHDSANGKVEPAPDKHIHSNKFPSFVILQRPFPT